MKNSLNNQVGILGDMFLWLVANLKQGVIYLIKQTCGNDILASVYVHKPYILHCILYCGFFPWDLLLRPKLTSIVQYWHMFDQKE